MTKISVKKAIAKSYFCYVKELKTFPSPGPKRGKVKRYVEREYECDVIDLKKGIKNTLLNNFYKDNPGTYPECLKSIRAILKCLKWPREYTFVGDYPNQANLAWSDEVNGVANDGRNWLIIQKNRIWKFPFEHDLRKPKGVFNTGIPVDLAKQGYNHFGDASYYKGFLFVPLGGDPIIIGYKKVPKDVERNPRYRATPIYSPKPKPRIVLFKQSPEGDPVYVDSTLLSYREVSTEKPEQLTEAPWCAINPLNELLYTSDFNNDGKPNFLYVFEPIYPTGGTIFDLKYKGKFYLYNRKGIPSTIESIQGGVFSQNGHLYLVSDRAFWDEDDNLVKYSGIYGFDTIRGREAKHIYVDYEPTFHSIIGSYKSQELEGIDICERGGWGQIHIMLNDNEPEEIGSTDDIYFKHYKVNSGDEYKI